MINDLELAIVRWAEKQSLKSRYGGPAMFVMDFLGCGCSMAYQFCAKHMPKNGWNESPPPAGVVVLGCEDLGDKPVKMKLASNACLYVKHGRKFEQVHPSYKARWWKAI